MTTEAHKTNTMSIMGTLDLGNPETDLQFTDGRVVRVPTALLLQQPFAEQRVQAPYGEAQTTEDEIRIPLLEEQLQVGKRTVATGTVRLHKSVESYDVTLDEPLAVTAWKVERVSKHEVVPEAPSVRQEGSTTVYPRVEERLVVTKELLLVEEIRVTREISERRDAQTVTLRRENLSVDRESVDPS